MGRLVQDNRRPHGVVREGQPPVPSTLDAANGLGAVTTRHRVEMHQLAQPTQKGGKKIVQAAIDSMLHCAAVARTIKKMAVMAKQESVNRSRRLISVRRRFMKTLRPQTKCGKQDLNLHGITTTRPST